MSENKNVLELESLRDEIQNSVKVFAEKLIADIPDNLQSITLIGSSLTEDFRPGKSDINSVLVLGKRTPDSLNIIANLARPMSKKKISAPLLMTSSYIERSLDVFGIEFLDFQQTHKTIFGNDPFVSLSFGKKDVRLQCERELKAVLIRLRQGYIASAANKKLVQDILISTSKQLVPLLRAMLWLKDVSRPTGAEATLNKAAVEHAINMNSLITVRKWQYEKVRLSKAEIENIFESVYTTIDQLAVIVDKLEA